MCQYRLRAVEDHDPGRRGGARGGCGARFPGLAGAAQIADWAQLTRAKDDLVETPRQEKYIDLLPDYPGIRYVAGRARFAARGLVVDGVPFAADKVVIATGATPRLPDIPGIGDVPVLDSTAALELAGLPRSLLVTGSG